MAAYAYPISIDRKRQTILELKEVELEGGSLSIERLAPIVGDNNFSVQYGESLRDPDYIISWCETREETDEEMRRRIEKAEAYNAMRYQLIEKGIIRPCKGEKLPDHLKQFER